MVKGHDNVNLLKNMHLQWPISIINKQSKIGEFSV